MTSGKAMSHAELVRRTGKVRLDVYLEPELAAKLDRLANKYGSKTLAVAEAIRRMKER